MDKTSSISRTTYKIRKGSNCFRTTRNFSVLKTTDSEHMFEASISNQSKTQFNNFTREEFYKKHPQLSLAGKTQESNFFSTVKMAPGNKFYKKKQISKENKIAVEDLIFSELNTEKSKLNRILSTDNINIHEFSDDIMSERIGNANFSLTKGALTERKVRKRRTKIDSDRGPKPFEEEKNYIKKLDMSKNNEQEKISLKKIIEMNKSFNRLFKETEEIESINRQDIKLIGSEGLQKFRNLNTKPVNLLSQKERVKVTKLREMFPELNKNAKHADFLLIVSLSPLFAMN